MSKNFIPTINISPLIKNNFFFDKKSKFSAVKKISFSVRKGETLGIVGESGSGKSVSALACLGLLSDNAVISGSINWHCQDHLNYDQKNSYLVAKAQLQKAVHLYLDYILKKRFPIFQTY